MKYPEYIDSLKYAVCADSLEPCLKALWFDARGDWDTAHEIVQEIDDSMAARIHAYLHRKQGDEWNSEYWYRRAGSAFPQDLSFEQEWESLVKILVE
jgi:hypothetical protein